MRSEASRVSSLGGVFRCSAERFSDRPALRVAGVTYEYGPLLQQAASLASVIDQVAGPDDGACALFARRSHTAYLAVLGIALSGRAYVPLHPAFPGERNRTMLALSGVRILIADGGSARGLADLLYRVEPSLTVILPDAEELPSELASCARHRFLLAPELPSRTDPSTLAEPAPESIAYLLFTSGTTGLPKGIGIHHRNVLAYLEAVAGRYDFGPEDRFSQNFELTFDLSVHDMFVCWSHGGCLCVPSPTEVMAPGRFLKEQELTCWFSTPSTAAVMSKLRLLRPGIFPSLRWSLFCGEPLAQEIAEAWQQAAPASAVENLYGPTEATIACTVYRYSSRESPAECFNGIVPIGAPLGRTRVAVVDAGGRPVPEGQEGELVLAGDQVACGYWRDPERTKGAFVDLPDLEGDGPWYRTGDLVSWSPNGDLLYRGRIDDQIKISGHRVEPMEIEKTVRQVAGAEAAVALGWPPTAAGAEGVIVFLVGSEMPDHAIVAACRRRLPDYMVPREIHRLEALPLTANRKVDRKRLLEVRAGLG